MGKPADLQGNVLGMRRLLNKLHQPAVGDFAEAIEHHPRPAAERFKRGVRIGSRQVVRHSNLERNPNVGIDHLRRSLRARHFNAALILHSRGVKDRIGVQSMCETAHGFHHEGVAHAIVPGLPEIASVDKLGERRDRDNQITGQNP